MGAQYVGQAVPNVQDLATARGSAGVLYDIIDRVSLVYFRLHIPYYIFHTAYSILGTRDAK